MGMPSNSPYQSRILLYDEQPTANGSLLPALQSSFRDSAVAVERSGLAALKTNLRRKYLAFVLPGINGPDSPYPDHLTPDIVDTLHKKIENGMIGIFICAGAAFFSRETRYDPPWGAPKRRNQLQPLFNGLAKGPVPELARSPEAGESVNDVTLAPVEYAAPDGTKKTTSVYYGNGTYFLPDDENDPHMKIIARFKDVEGNPPAIMRIQRGKGFCYFMAVHPEIGPIELNKNSALKAEDYEQKRKLVDALRIHETGRQELWGMITQDILDHRANMMRSKLDQSPKI